MRLPTIAALTLTLLLGGCVTPAMSAYNTTRAEFDAAFHACRSCSERAKDSAAVPCEAVCAQAAMVAPLLAERGELAGRANMQRAKPQSQPAAPTQTE